MKNKYILTFSILLMLLNGCGNTNSSDKMKAMMKNKIAEVNLITPKEELAEIETVLSAKAEAKQIVEIKPRTEGFVEKIYVKDFSNVVKGQVLYKIEDSQLKNTIESNKAEVFKTKTIFQAATLNLERFQELYKTNSISKSELDNAKSTYAQAKSNYLTAESILKTNQLNLSYTNITAPISGTLEDNKVYAGTLVNPSTGLLNKIYDMSTVFLFTSVPDDIFDKVKNSSFSYENKDIKLDSCSPTIDETTKLHTCKFVLSNALNITNGQQIKITMKTQEKVLTVPQKSITQNKASKAVFIIKDNKAEYQNIEVGDWVNDLIVVKSGLKKDDLFVENIAKVKFGGEVKLKVK